MRESYTADAADPCFIWRSYDGAYSQRLTPTRVNPGVSEDKDRADAVDAALAKYRAFTRSNLGRVSTPASLLALS